MGEKIAWKGKFPARPKACSQRNWNTEYKSESYRYTIKTIAKIMSG